MTPGGPRPDLNVRANDGAVIQSLLSVGPGMTLGLFSGLGVYKGFPVELWEN